MTKTKHLSFEQLERRDLRAAFSSPWPEVDSLSLSFLPDGTQVGSVQSQLQQSLSKSFAGSDWQLEVLRAFQSWTRETNANIALREDQGLPVGTLGFKQGDVRFGDIRIGAFPMEKDVLAVANPYDPFIANTWVGDIFLNSDNTVLGSSSNPAESLYSIMLHEAGHVLGVGHSDDIASPMFPHFQDVESKLSTRDIEILQNLYGTRKIDSWEGLSGNETLQSATFISSLSESGILISPEWRGDLSTSSDVDFYRYDVPSNTHSLDIYFNAQGISLLTGKVTISNADGEILATSSAIDPRDNSLHIVLQDLLPGDTLFAKVESADASVFGVGSYEILISPRSDMDSTFPPVGYAGESEHFHDGEQVLATTPGYVEHTYYEAEGSLSIAHPSQSYRVRSSDSPKELQNVFTVVVGVTNTSIDNLRVMILDTSGNFIPYSVISDDQNELAIQVVGVKSDTDYLVIIEAGDTISARELASRHIGYELEVDFAHDGAHLETLVSDSLDDNQPVFENNFLVSESSQYHFALSASDFGNVNNSGLEMYFVDSQGTRVASMQVTDGATRTFSVFLAKGNYRIQFVSPNRPNGATIIFQWSGVVTSSPIGPQLRDTVNEPIESTLATPLITLQSYWSPDRSPVSANSMQIQYLASSTDVVSTRTSPTSFVDTSEESGSILTVIVNNEVTSQASATIQQEKRNGLIAPKKPSNVESSTKNARSLDRKSLRSRSEKVDIAPALVAPSETPIPKDDADKEPISNEKVELKTRDEVHDSLSAFVEPFFPWLKSKETTGIGFLLAMLTGIVLTSHRRPSQQKTSNNNINFSFTRVRFRNKS